MEEAKNDFTDVSTSNEDSDEDEFFEPLDANELEDLEPDHLRQDDLQQFNPHPKDFELPEGQNATKSSRKIQAKFWEIYAKV